MINNNYFKHSQQFIMLLLMSLLLANCGTVHKAVKHNKLEVQTKMSDTIFLDPVPEEQMTAYIRIRNTSDKRNLEIVDNIKSALRSQGFKIVSNPKKAHFMIQANILQVGKSKLDDPFASAGGYGAGLTGALAGGAIGAYAGGDTGSMLAGGLIGGAVSVVADAMVEIVQYTMITDLQISERADGTIVNEASNAKLKQGSSGYKTSSWKQKTDWKKYQTRIVSVAKKTNLKFEAALPELKQGLIRSISGLL